ncbi:AsmA family protein [Aestuariivirga sp.]|uniref:AsmA family protein n=1 Tax=Aestuariivirga sp. TaxID=2650926 RepID=UPI0039E274B9
MRKGLIWAGGSLLVLAMLAAVVWFGLQPGWAIAMLQERTQQVLGRAMLVKGGAHLELSPTLAIRFDDVALPAPSGFDDALLTASSIRVPVTFSSLLSHRLEATPLSLDGADINMVINEMGQVNWPSTLPRDGATLSLLFNDASISFRDGRSGQTLSATRANLAIDTTAAGEMTLNGTAVINEQLAKLQGYVKDPSRVITDGSPAEFTLDSPPLTLAFNGRLSTVGGVGLAGTLTASGPNLRNALAWTGAPLQGSLGLKSFSASGALDATGRALGLHRATVALDDLTLTGDLTLDYRADVPKLQAILTAEQIDLDRYIPAAGATADNWGRTPFNFSVLRGLDGAVTLDAKALTYGGAALGPTRIDAQLAGGTLQATIASSTALTTKVTLDGSGDGNVLSLGIVGTSAPVTAELAPLLGRTIITGTGDYALSLTTSGATQEEMMSSLKGTGRMSLRDGALVGLDVVKSLTAVSREVQDGWPAVGQTSFSSLTAEADFADGIATLKNAKMESPALVMSATGTIDMLRRAVDLRADPRLVTNNNGELAGLPVAVVVKGDWAAPRIYPDMADILTNPKTAYEQLKAAGLPPALTGN